MKNIERTLKYHSEAFKIDNLSPVDLSKLASEAKQDGLADKYGESTAKPAKNPDKILPNYLSNITRSRRNFFEEQIHKAKNRLFELQGIADEGLSRVKEQNLRTELNIRTPLLSKFNLANKKSGIDLKGVEYLAFNGSLIKYKLLHNILFMPRNSDKSMGSIIWFLFAMFLLEAILNTGLFIEAKGGMGAFVLAFTQAFVNIGSCFLIGWKVIGAAINGFSRLSRGVAWGCIALQIILIIWLNLALGLYRSILLSNQGDEPSAEQTIQILTPWTNFELYEMTSVIVVLFGLVLAAVSYIKGYYCDDPHPSYGSHYRHAKNSQNDLKKEIKITVDEWSSAIQEHNIKLREIYQWGLDGIRFWSSAINEMEKIKSDLNELVDEMNDEINQIKSVYTDSYMEGQSLPYLPFELNVKSFNPLNIETYLLDVSQYFLEDNKRLELKDKLVDELNVSFKHTELVFKNKIESISNEIDDMLEKTILPIGSMHKIKKKGYFVDYDNQGDASEMVS